MDKITKLQILLTINQMKLNELMEFIQSGDITFDEMIANGLLPATAIQIQDQQNKEKQHKVTEEEMIATCKKIENGEVNTIQIKSLLLEGGINEELLLAHTSLTPDMVSKIKNYQKQPTPFLAWADLPPLKKGFTDLYFFGQPGSGKSCILASVFYYLEQQAMIIENVHNPEGLRYRNQLTNEISYGILPDSTAAEGINYIPLELRNPEHEGTRHPLNFIEMSGELFNRAYDQGIGKGNIGAKEYLNNTNKKLIYLIIDYHQHERSKTVSSGPSQASRLQAILALLDNFGTLNHTDGIYIVVTKSDLFPPGVDKNQYAKEFLERNYRNLLMNCKDLQQKYRDRFKIIVYPYSIGNIKFQNLLMEFDLRSPEILVEDILVDSFVTKKTGLRKYF